VKHKRKDNECHYSKYELKKDGFKSIINVNVVHSLCSQAIYYKVLLHLQLEVNGSVI